MIKKHGGKRNNAGRKSIPDKKITVSIYPRQSEVEIVGGIDAAKALAVSAIERKVKKLKKS